ncbi:uncharacterized protein [Palaemon carinicauda]|uniref:uncharacterized protein n=1 Tax=Palaemon carinicauda TaxID=392227 RepID=UPI0035B5A996
MAQMLLLVLLAVAQLSAAGFYKPLPQQCPVRQKVDYEDVVLTVTRYNTLTSAVPLGQAHLNTLTVTDIITVTNIVPTTLTAVAQQVAVTDVRIVESVLRLPFTQVITVTETLTNTQVDVITSTATNYVTTFQTIFSTLTHFDVIKQTETQFVDNPSVQVLTALGTQTITSSVFETTSVTVTVPGLEIQGTTTFTSIFRPTSTHFLTKKITQTVCPPGSNAF